MVGNDIVDISEAKHASNWQRPRFLEKLFTNEEQKCIQNAPNPFLKVWHLWSMKEAAYKLYTQLYPSKFYNPKGFACSMTKDFGIVKFKTFTCYVTTQITSDYIISEARLNSEYMTSKVIKFDNRNPQKQSETIRKVLIEAGTDRFNISTENMKILSSKHGVPSLQLPSKTVPLSITHHGYYGAFAIS